MRTDNQPLSRRKLSECRTRIRRHRLGCVRVTYRCGDEVSAEVDTVEAEALEGLVSLESDRVRAGTQGVPNGCTVQGPHLVSVQVKKG
jgi:hypothetical protein